jgi:hypothetical protein
LRDFAERAGGFFGNSSAAAVVILHPAGTAATIKSHTG